MAPDSAHTPINPKQQDAVLGGQTTSASGKVVLGGLAGVQQRLRSSVIEQRIAALQEALAHGTDGLNLILFALDDPSDIVRHHAYTLLANRPEEFIQTNLQRFRIREIKRQIFSSIPEQQIQALPDALALGPEGLNLVIRALNHSTEQVQQAAFHLLREYEHPQVQQALSLFSNQGINYTHLKHLLAKGNWRLADQETHDLIYKACGLAPDEITQFPNLDNLPCSDLYLIDQLWMKHSQGRFGFSAQKPIWDYCYNTYWDKGIMWKTFGSRVGWHIHHILKPNHWKRYHEISFSLDAPIGHLPFLGNRFGIFTVERFTQRLMSCS